MNPYQDLIDQYLFAQFPTTPACSRVVFEAVSAAVLGTKQRRFGPQLPPESQTAVRDVLRHDGPITFFLPWGASKDDPQRGVDVMELSALKQLACLRDELKTMGRDVKYVFRVENLTEMYIIGNYDMPDWDWHKRQAAIKNYSFNFQRLVELILPGSEVRPESDCVSLDSFLSTARELFPRFDDYLTWGGADRLAALAEVGWRGDIPASQRDHYKRAYLSQGIPSHLHNRVLARYFAATLARIKTGATRVPTDADGKVIPHVQIAFNHPVPDSPMKTARVYYRTIPERYTNHHRTPWTANGYLRINDDGTVTPRPILDEQGIMPNKTVWNGVELHLDYLSAD